MSDDAAKTNGADLVRTLAATIRENAAYLSEIDGAIGDGDHGINMKKGFDLAESRLSAEVSLSEALSTVGRTLLMETGGAMGPLYGRMFKAMGSSIEGSPELTAEAFQKMLDAAVEAVQKLGNAKPGDKTLVDTLVPARELFHERISAGVSLEEALTTMSEAAERGKESTRDMVAKLGRSSRLGERSRGVLDAGATSCALILKTMADYATRRSV